MVKQLTFDNHTRSKFWNYELNGNIKPSDLTYGSNKKCWFKCEKCEHNFNSSISSIISNNRWCPYCTNQKLCKNKKECGKDNDCDFCFEKSFASNPRSKYWCNEINNCKPRDVFKNTHNKFWFKCEKCEHRFESSLCHISNNKWCPYCVNHKLCENNDCGICFEKSFASHSREKYWCYDLNKYNPRDILKNSHVKYWFKCENKHSFDSSLSNITSGNHWCSLCKNKTEKKLYEWFISKKYIIKYQPRFKWCKNEKTRCLPFDFLINNKILIELDGRQHFIQVSNWNSPEINLDNDKFKTNKSIENNYCLIRILQEDVYNNTNNWEEKLITVINEIKPKQCIFIDNNNIYKNNYNSDNSDYIYK